MYVNPHAHARIPSSVAIDPPDFDDPAEVTDEHTEAAQAQHLADAGLAAETLLESAWIRDHALALLDASPHFRAEYLAAHAGKIAGRAQEIAEEAAAAAREGDADYSERNFWSNGHDEL